MKTWVFHNNGAIYGVRDDEQYIEGQGEYYEYDTRPEELDNIPEGMAPYINLEDGTIYFEPVPETLEEPSRLDTLGQELAQMKIKDIHQQNIIDGLGRELTNAKIEIMQLKGAQTS